MRTLAPARSSRRQSMSLDIASKLLGRNLANHPYFAYHKVHIEILAKALDASSAWTMPRGLAVGGGRSTAGPRDWPPNAKAMPRTAGRWCSIMPCTARLTMPSSCTTMPQSENRSPDNFQAINFTPETLQADADRQVEDWREQWHQLANDALFAPVDGTGPSPHDSQEVMDEYDRRRKKLESDKNVFSFLAAKRLEEDDQWRRYDLATQVAQRDARRAGRSPQGQGLPQPPPTLANESAGVRRWL